jgi:mono/diheme cytochrome c family protein
MLTDCISKKAIFPRENKCSRLLRCPGVAFVAMAAASAFGADPSQGETLVQHWRSSCHIVGPQQQGSTTEATPFAVVAKRPDFDVSKLAFFLLDPRPKMPNMQLSRTEAAGIAAYIASLK